MDIQIVMKADNEIILASSESYSCGNVIGYNICVSIYMYYGRLINLEILWVYHYAIKIVIFLLLLFYNE
jgi:hypothetical protein